MEGQTRTKEAKIDMTELKTYIYINGFKFQLDRFGFGWAYSRWDIWQDHAPQTSRMFTNIRQGIGRLDATKTEIVVASGCTGDFRAEGRVFPEFECQSDLLRFIQFASKYNTISDKDLNRDEVERIALGMKVGVSDAASK